MSLILHHHPLSSFSQKVLVALYESGTKFESAIVNFGDEKSRADFFALWPMGKIPVLRDERLGRTIPETSIIIEYLDTHYPGPRRLLPNDATLRLEARLWDRLFDCYVQVPMQKIVADRMRPASERDPRGVAEARATLRTAYALIEGRASGRTWAVGETFSLADCAAAPALFYAGIISPFSDFPSVAAYFDRLAARPSFARALAEARPYFDLFPFRDDIPARFLSGDSPA
jgi:glutathione S-transferase